MISNPLWNETGYKENTEDVEMDLLAHCELSWSNGDLYHDACPPCPTRPIPAILAPKGHQTLGSVCSSKWKPSVPTVVDRMTLVAGGSVSCFSPTVQERIRRA